MACECGPAMQEAGHIETCDKHNIRKPSQLIYSTGDIANMFKVHKSVPANWVARYKDTPEPDFVTPAGDKFWADLSVWRVWHEECHLRRPF